MERALAVTSYDEIERAALAMAKSGYFADVKDQAQAVVKILAGQEIGFGPFASMRNVNIIKGSPSINANLMASAVKGSQKYDYRLKELTNTACVIEFYQIINGKYESIGVSSFTIEDARKAGTQNLEKYPRNMLFARAMSNGVRWYCPDVTNGNAVYTPEELGAEVDGEGNVINASFAEVKPSNNGHEPEPLPFEPKMSLETAKAITNSSGIKYGDLSQEVLEHLHGKLTDALKGKLDAAKKEQYQYKLDAIEVILNSDHISDADEYVNSILTEEMKKNELI